MLKKTDEYHKVKQSYLHRCVFCEPAEQLVLFSSENFYVILDVAPILLGHALICSKNHHACAGEIPRHLMNELVMIKNQVADIWREVFGHFVFYEHGRAGHCISYASADKFCHHFHLHILSSSKSIMPLLKKRFMEVKISSYLEIPDVYEKFGEYLYYEEGDNCYVYPVSEAIESHLLRTYISQVHNVPKRADWMRYNNLKLVRQEIEKLQSCVLYV